MEVSQSLFITKEHQGALDCLTLRTPMTGSIHVFLEEKKKGFEIDSGGGHLLKTET